MESQGWWDEARETSLKDTEKRKVLEALSKAENKPDPSRDTMFDDVRLALLTYLTGLISRLHGLYGGLLGWIYALHLSTDTHTRVVHCFG